MGRRKEVKKNGTSQKTLVSGSASFLAAMVKVLFLEGGLGTRLCLQPTLRVS